MPGSIRISAIQLPVTDPLFLQVAVGKREYSGNIGQDDFSFPVTSLRETMVMMLHNADRELISKSELKTKAVVESGTMDAVFTLDRGGKIILQLQFLLSDEDRKRIQDMRNSVKRKQQELLGNGYEIYFQDGPLSKQPKENINNIPSKGDQPTLRKSMSLDDLHERATFSGTSVDPHMDLRDMSLQSGGNTSSFDDPIDADKGYGEPESRSSSAVKKMISAFEGTSSQDLSSMMRIRSESSIKGMYVSSEAPSKTSIHGALVNSSDHTQPELVSRDRGLSSRSGRHDIAMLSNKKSDAASAMQSKNTRGDDSRRRSHRRPKAKDPYSLEQMHPISRYHLHHLAAASSIWVHPHVCITTASRQLKDLVELEQLQRQRGGAGVSLGVQESKSDDDERGNVVASARRTDGFPVLDGWLVNQGVRVVIVIIACGAIFLNNR